MKKIAFLDRDGVLNKEINYLHKIDDFILIDDSIDALKNLLDLNFELVIITNQAGIAKGIFSEKQYFELTDFYLKKFQKYGIKFLEVLYCPNHPNGKISRYKKDCSMRKPKPGMINIIKEKYEVDLNNSIIVGDKVSDIECGMNAGINNFYLVESGHKISDTNKRKYQTFKNLHSVTLFLMKHKFEDSHQC